MRRVGWLLLGTISLAGITPLLAFARCTESSPAQTQQNPSAPMPAGMDHDLLEITIPQLKKLYAAHQYTVSQVVRWYLARIAKYDGIYHAVQTIDAGGALATAAEEDAAAEKGGSNFQRRAMWGVPILIKANTSIKGLVTTDGWEGYRIPGHELIAPQDATVVVKLRAAGAVILGQTNMPDFADSDTTRSTAFGRTGNAYDVRFSPGGSSGGTVPNHVEFRGTGDWNGYRQFHSDAGGHEFCGGRVSTRGLVSIAGIAPLDWLLDNRSHRPQRDRRCNRVKRDGRRGSNRPSYDRFIC